MAVNKAIKITVGVYILENLVIILFIFGFEEDAFSTAFAIFDIIESDTLAIALIVHVSERLIKPEKTLSHFFTDN